MELRSPGGSPSVEVPSASGDRPRWSKVAVIAAIGFVVGVAWPRLAGVRLGPAVPEAASAATSATAGDPAVPSADPSNAPAAVLAAAPPALAPPPVAVAPMVTPSHGSIFACKTIDGEALHGADCGSLPGLDSVVVPRLRKLTDCPAAAGATGALHLVVHVDFARGLAVELGHARGTSAPDALLACAKAALAGGGVIGIPHDHPRYSVAYAVGFAAAESAPASSIAPSVPSAAANAPPPAGNSAAREGASPSAEVEWEAAIVRDVPKTGKIVARLPRGTALRVGSIKDGWYPIKYGDGFASEGWVYRGAIGR